MNRFLAATRTRAGWCSTLLLTEFALWGAQPATDTPAAATHASGVSGFPLLTNALTTRASSPPEEESRSRSGQSALSSQSVFENASLLSLKQAQDVAFERNWDLLAAKSGIDA